MYTFIHSVHVCISTPQWTTFDLSTERAKLWKSESLQNFSAEIKPWDWYDININFVHNDHTENKLLPLSPLLPPPKPTHLTSVYRPLLDLDQLLQNESQFVGAELFGSGTDSISLHILLLRRCSSKSLTLRCFKLSRDEMWQDCTSTKYTLVWYDTFQDAGHEIHLLLHAAVSTGCDMQQFLIHSTFVLAIRQMPFLPPRRHKYLEDLAGLLLRAVEYR